MTVLEVCKILLWAALFAALAFIAIRVALWLNEIKFFQIIWAKITHNIAKQNLLHRENLKKKVLAERQEFKRTEYTLLEKIYLMIDQTGIMNKLPPGFNELSVLISYGQLVGIAALIVGLVYKSVVLALLLVVGTVVLTRQICHMIIRHRRIKLESELFIFINACQCSASTHTDIINIFEDIYDQMQAPLNTMLEQCVAEANYTSDKAMALKHLKESTSSIQFYSVINNLEVCSQTSGDYEKVIENLRDTLRIYSASLEKKKSLLRNARMNGAIMAVLGGVILYMCNIFFDGFIVQLFTSTVGIALFGVMLFLIVIGLTQSVE